MMTGNWTFAQPRAGEYIFSQFKLKNANVWNMENIDFKDVSFGRDVPSLPNRRRRLNQPQEQSIRNEKFARDEEVSDEGNFNQCGGSSATRWQRRQIQTASHEGV